jgi:hypothetical protein
LETETSAVSGIDFAISGLGGISGQVTAEPSGTPVAGITFTLYKSDGYALTRGVSASDGTYQVTGIYPGIYYVRANTSSSIYLSEVYADLPCHPDCDPSAGKPVLIELEKDTPTIDFSLQRLGRITGYVYDLGSGQALNDGQVFLQSLNQTQTFSDSLSFNGTYVFDDVPPGDYYLLTDISDEAFIDEAYSGGAAHCPLFSCDPSVTLEPITIESGAFLSGFNFHLEQYASISGSLVEESTGLPLTDAMVDLYTDDGTLWATTSVDFDGNFGFDREDHVAPGTFLVHARPMNLRYEDMLYEDISCGFVCDILMGTPILTSSGQDVTGIDFSFEDHSIFVDDFEDGTFSAWSQAVGASP